MSLRKLAEAAGVRSQETIREWLGETPSSRERKAAGTDNGDEPAGA